MSDNGWIGVDLDGTLAYYDGWKGLLHVGKPILPMVERIKGWLAAGKTVKIFTARVSVDKPLREIATHVIQTWLVHECDLPRLEVTNQKDFAMELLYDDRAVSVEFNTGIPLELR